jgi:predicted outer membrane protein
MSLTLTFRLGLASASLSCLLASVVMAQQAQQSSGRTAAQRDDSARASTSGQRARASAGQDDRFSSQHSAERSGQSAQSHTANFRGNQATAGGASQAIDQFYANCLLTQIQGEVDLSELAQQKAENPQVKQFAEQMIEDHRQMMQQLQQIASTQAGSRASATSATETDTRSDAGSVASGRRDTDISTEGTPGTTSARSDTDTAQATSRSSASDLPGSSGASSTTSQSGLSATGATGSGVVMQLAAIDTQIAQRKLQMTKDELQQKSGAEFDKCYIGSAIPAHVHALAALEVLGQQSQGQLAQLAQQAKPKVQQHLDHAKELMQQLEGQSTGSRDNSQAERSSSRTQR